MCNFAQEMKPDFMQQHKSSRVVLAIKRVIAYDVHIEQSPYLSHTSC